MNKLATRWLLLGIVAAALAGACETSPPASGGPGTATAPTASAATAATTTAAAPTAGETAAPSVTASADPAPTASTTATTAPTGTGTAGTAATGKPEDKYACGGKGQPACPMQGWMKGVMARAVAGGDKDKIAQALNTIASKPVAGMDQWAAIAAAGAAKAQAGDIDGAKESCKKCHALYQKKYKETMRDRPW
jgi:hypothetical protein